MQTTITINGITKEIELTEEQAKQFEKPKVWKPKIGDIYSFVDTFGGITKVAWMAWGVDNARLALGIAAETEEECEFIRKKMLVTKQLRDYADEHNEPIDWGNYKQAKYLIGWDFYSKKLQISGYWTFKGIDVYFSSEEITKAAVKEVGEENVKKYYLGVKD